MGITRLMKKSLQMFRLGLLVAGLFCLGSAAQAVTETITLPTTINVDDTSHDNNDLVIIGTTVTINGAHPFHSLALQSGAVLNHTAALAAGMKLTVAQNVTIDASSKIDVSGQGFGVETRVGRGRDFQLLRQRRRLRRLRLKLRRGGGRRGLRFAFAAR